jgi:pimeloyl-ACP methyl ester carboxylesterase
LRLFAREIGSSAPAIVFLHGFGGSHDAWRAVADALAEEHRTIAYDLPGHGRSLHWPDAGPPKVAVGAVFSDLDARGIRTAHFVGHSMGGAIAALAAIGQPDRVASLTLLAPGGFGEEINGPLLRRYAAARSADEIRECLKAMSGPQAVISDETVRKAAEMRAIPGQTEKLVEIAATITRNDRQGAISRDDLSALPMPVAVAWSREDSVLPYSQAEKLPPHFVLHTIEEKGHLLPQEAPGLVADIIRRTIGGAAPQSSEQRVV